MAKASGSTRKVTPSTKSRQTTISDFNEAMNSGQYDKNLSYLPENGSGSMLYQIGHNYHIEEVEVGRALADKGYRVVLTPEGVVAYATAFKKDGTPKYAEGTISGILYDQKTAESNLTNAVNNVDHAVKHAVEKNSEIALIYDKYGKIHRGDIGKGMAKFKQHKPIAAKSIVAVLVVDKNMNLYEHHFD